MELKLASLNVRSIKSTARCVNALQYLAKVKADVTFLQECGLPHLRCSQMWSRWWPHRLSVWSGRNDCRASGLGILLLGGNFASTEGGTADAGLNQRQTQKAGVNQRIRQHLWRKGSSMAAASLPSPFTLFESNQPGPVYRIPSLLYLNSHQVFLAFAEKRTSSSDVDAKILVLRRGSFQDGSVEWDKAVELRTAVKSGYRSMNPCPVYERQKQVVYLFFNCVKEGVNERSQVLRGRNAARLCYVTSQDAGLTWGQVTDLTESVIGEQVQHWGTFSVSPGHGIQRACGTLVVPAYAYIIRYRCCLIPPGCFTKPHTFYLYSEDGGERWRVGEPVSLCGTGESEVAEIAVTYGNRVLYCNARTDPGPLSCCRPSRVEAVSLEPGRFEIVHPARQLPESDAGCQGSVVSFSCPASDQLSWLLYTHPVGSGKDRWWSHCRNRTNLAVYLNHRPLDQRCWEGPWVIQPGPSGYSDLAYLNETSTFACLYECGDQQPNERIDFRLFSIDDVLRNI